MRWLSLLRIHLLARSGEYRMRLGNEFSCHSFQQNRRIVTVGLDIRRNGQLVVTIAQHETCCIPHFVAEVAVGDNFVDIQIDVSCLPRKWVSSYTIESVTAAGINLLCVVDEREPKSIRPALWNTCRIVCFNAC